MRKIFRCALWANLLVLAIFAENSFAQGAGGSAAFLESYYKKSPVKRDAQARQASENSDVESAQQVPLGRLVTNEDEIQRARVKLVDGKLPPHIKDGIPRIDASNEDTFQQSFFEALMALDDAMQEKFSAGMTTIGVMLSSHADPQLVREVYHNKTPDEIIAISRRLAPSVKDNTLIVDGSDINEFGKSVGKIMVNLEPDKQMVFSEALAKFMHGSDKDNHEKLLKTLDGKTADEIIKMASTVQVPFDIMSAQNKAKREVEIESVSKEEAEETAKRGVFVPTGEDAAKPAETEEAQEEAPALSESLSPSSIIPND